MPGLALTPRTRRNAVMAIAHPPAGRYLALDDGGETVLIAVRAGMTRLGRSLSADIALEDGAASRRHALLISRPGAPAEVVDDGSLNGTFVNGERVARSVLAHGDLIRVGRTDLRFLEIAGAAAADTEELPPAGEERRLRPAA